MSLIDDLLLKLDDAKRIAELIKGSVANKVKAGENLQSYLDKGGNVEIEAGATFSAERFTFSRSINLLGKGKLVGTAGPAIYIPPTGVSDINITDVECLARYGVVVQLGSNDVDQTKLEQVPTRIKLNRITVPFHDGKRALEINSSKTEILDCNFLNVWDASPSESDSHPWAILNSPGEILIQGGKHSAGSELGLIGGDYMKIPGVEPTNIIIKDLLLFRPLEWFTDSVYRKYKCGLECKTGHKMLFQNLTIDGNMKFAQPDAFALQLTPRSAGSITDVEVDGMIVRNSPSFCGITSFNDAAVDNPVKTTGIRMKNLDMILDSVKYKGDGRVFLLQGSLTRGGIGTLDISNFKVVNPVSNAFIYSDKAKIDRISVVGCESPTGTYGISLGGNHWGNLANQVVTDLKVEGNTFSQANATFKKNFPLNTFI